MFSRRMNSVVNMDPRYMAAHDGSEQAAGRGSGKDKPRNEDKMPEQETALEKMGVSFRGGRSGGDGDAPPESNEQHVFVGLEQRTPYMNMAYAPQERRLDIAVYRALFASSARQARQFCVHGAVKVNGQVVCSPWPYSLLTL